MELQHFMLFRVLWPHPQQAVQVSPVQIGQRFSMVDGSSEANLPHGPDCTVKRTSARMRPSRHLVDVSPLGGCR